MAGFRSILIAVLLGSFPVYGESGAEERPSKGRVGLAVDAGGGPTIDPTENVIALVKAQALSLAALREADIKYNDSQQAHIKELTELRAKHAEVLRISDLERLAATRQVDVLAATNSAAQLATAVQTLATTSDRNAETLRNLVTATANTMAKQTADQAQVLSTQTDTLVKDINARIAELQKSAYTGAGKQAVSDPAMVILLEKIEKLVTEQSADTGKSAGVSMAWVVGLGALAGVASMVALFQFAAGSAKHRVRS